MCSDPDSVGDLSEAGAHGFFAAMLDGGVPDLERGAVLCALRIRRESPMELGFYRAVSERVNLLKPPASAVRPLVVTTYGGARHEAQSASSAVATPAAYRRARVVARDTGGQRRGCHRVYFANWRADVPHAYAGTKIRGSGIARVCCLPRFFARYSRPCPRCAAGSA